VRVLFITPHPSLLPQGEKKPIQILNALPENAVSLTP
jgi:hypothetical protein